MNTDIDYMKIADGDKAFVAELDNFVNGRVSSWASRLANEAYGHLIDADLIFDSDYIELKNK